MTKHLVVIDDDPAIRDAISLVLNHSLYTITTYNSAEPLLKGEIEKPDLIILDKQLSGIDGLEVCRQLKSREDMRHIPVLLISATPDIRQLAEAVNADDALEKPFRIKDLKEMVARLVPQPV